MFFSNNLDLEGKGAGRTRRSEWITMRKGTKQSRLYKLSRKRVGAGDPRGAVKSEFRAGDQRGSRLSGSLGIRQTEG